MQTLLFATLVDCSLRMRGLLSLQKCRLYTKEEVADGREMNIAFEAAKAAASQYARQPSTVGGLLSRAPAAADAAAAAASVDAELDVLVSLIPAVGLGGHAAAAVSLPAALPHTSAHALHSPPAPNNALEEAADGLAASYGSNAQQQGLLSPTASQGAASGAGDPQHPTSLHPRDDSRTGEPPFLLSLLPHVLLLSLRIHVSIPRPFGSLAL